MDEASLSFTISRSLLKLMSTESVMPSNHLIFCHPLLLLPSNFPSIGVFSSESALLIRWLKYWSFSISSSNEYSGLISFRIDWIDLLTVQGTLKGCGILTLNSGVWDLVLQPGFEPGPTSLVVWRFSHWTTREILGNVSLCTEISNKSQVITHTGVQGFKTSETKNMVEILLNIACVYIA